MQYGPFYADVAYRNRQGETGESRIIWHPVSYTHLNHGVLNSNVEYTRATKNPTSPYTSYSRTGLALNYQNTFAKVLRFNFGVTANIGGMNTEDDPDAQKGEWEKVRDNVLRANTSLKWLLNRSWITSLDFDASLNYTDNLARKRTYNLNSTSLPAVHAEQEGY